MLIIELYWNFDEIFFIDGGGWVDYCDGNSYGRNHKFFIEHSGHFFPFIDLRKRCPLYET